MTSNNAGKTAKNLSSMIKLKIAIEEIAKKNPDGFTISLPSLKSVKKGISVAYLETQNSFDSEGLEKVLNHALEHEKIVGGWLDEEDGKYYYDSCKIFENREEAIKFGKQNKQIAIFDITNLELIKL
jgi:hypothetical protein